MGKKYSPAELRNMPSKDREQLYRENEAARPLTEHYSQAELNNMSSKDRAELEAQRQATLNKK